MIKAALDAGANPLSLWIKRRRLEIDSEKQLAKIAREVGGDAPQEQKTYATAAGDERRLRGIPALARGVGSTITGTDPLRETLRRERQALRTSDNP